MCFRKIKIKGKMDEGEAKIAKIKGDYGERFIEA
jgi:hypothetical protein